MGLLPGCGEKKLIDCPLSKIMGDWRKIAKFDTMIDNIDHPHASKVCKCKRANARGILQYVKDKSKECVFHIVTKITP